MFLAMLRSETAAAPERRDAALRGLRRYQRAERGPPRPPMPAIARAGRAALRDFGGAGPPLVVVPSLINPPDVLDLAGDRSLLRWLAGEGVRPLLVDWGVPGRDERALTIAGHVETMLLPLLAAVGEPAALLGYCLGGTMALAAATRHPVRGLALLASPWRFARYPAATRAELRELWGHAQGSSEALGVLPMEVLQAAFWRLDPARTVAKYEALGDGRTDEPALARFVALEDWANEGPPLTFGAARELFENLFAADRPGGGGWQVGGRAVDPATLSAPVLEIVSTSDRIAPAVAAAGLGTRVETAAGHVGMVVGSRARADVWQPLAAWLSHLRQK